MFKNQILFCKRAGIVDVNAIRLWLVAIATILSKTCKIYFLFMGAIAHNWSYFTKSKQTLGPYVGYHSTLGEIEDKPNYNLYKRQVKYSAKQWKCSCDVLIGLYNNRKLLGLLPANKTINFIYHNEPDARQLFCLIATKLWPVKHHLKEMAM